MRVRGRGDGLDGAVVVVVAVGLVLGQEDLWCEGSGARFALSLAHAKV